MKSKVYLVVVLTCACRTMPAPVPEWVTAGSGGFADGLAGVGTAEGIVNQALAAQVAKNNASVELARMLGYLLDDVLVKNFDYLDPEDMHRAHRVERGLLAIADGALDEAVSGAPWRDPNSGKVYVRAVLPVAAILSRYEKSTAYEAICAEKENDCDPEVVRQKTLRDLRLRFGAVTP